MGQFTATDRTCSLLSRFYEIKRAVAHYLHRFTHYEYWSYWFFYSPVIIYVFFKSLKHRNFLLLTATNPMIKHSGALLESKKEINSFIPSLHFPKTIYFSKSDSLEVIIEKLKSYSMNYPIIAKPDIGERGDNIRIIQSEPDLKYYLTHNANSDFHLQEYLKDGFEAGVFVVKRPGKSLQITSITTKGLFQVYGDGQKTLLELVKDNPRYYFLSEKIQKIYPKHPWNEILAFQEIFIIEPIANHSRGTAFLNSNHLLTPELTQFFSQLVNELPEFYYGRFDIKASDLETFQKGKTIKILELNGLFGEPGHIYDPSYSLFEAWRDLLKHWSWAYEIALENKKKGHSPSSLIDIFRMFREYFSLH